eukprot:TRINITY_DN41827_c0_g1_i1.p1 TRINITY_DN41827_c0_g1~~TRINITY_DN41827_c0_g1_i1.p1  ORF type:complete len:317 (-),score=24.84 TRINITY_DN41827_c0_g1_i1:274-1152(-)
MSLKQLNLECEALGLDTHDSEDRDTLVEILTRYDADAAQPRCVLENLDRLRFDTANADNLSTQHNDILSPSYGPVCIPVCANGVPVMAFLSSASLFTIVSPALANYAGIPYSDIKGDKEVVCANGTCFFYDGLVRSLTVTLAHSVEVTLHTAVVSSTFARGLQLGMDFFAQAVRSQMDVFARVDCDDRVMCEIDHLEDVPRFLIGERISGRREVLRCHTAEGATSVVPLKHCQDNIVGTVWFGSDAKVDCCSWCGRAFPGLKACSVCKDAYYCSTVCQNAHWPEHKMTVAHQ